MKTRLLFRLMCISACLLMALQAGAYDYTENGIYYSFTDYDEETGVASVENNGSTNTYSGNVVVPQSVYYNGKTYTVTSIGYQAFKGSTGLTDVSLPETITYLMNEAFAGCTGLTSITLPASVSSIYNNVFTGCTNLASVTCCRTTARQCSTNNFDAATYANATLYVPIGSLSSYQSTAPWSSFADIQESATFQDNGIYYKITGANTASVTYRDKNYNSYSGTVIIPRTVNHNGSSYNVTAIDTMAFRQCDALTQVTIPTSITAINYAAFYKCTALTALTIPNSVLTIGDQAFRESALAQIYIGNNVTTIGRSCFYHCEALTNMIIPNSVNQLGDLCFQGCTALKSVTLGTGLTAIPLQCFVMCESLSSINFGTNTAIKEFAEYSFYRTGFTRFDVPAGVEIIKQSAFEGCEKLESIFFSYTVHSIGYYVLNSCPLLAEITVDGGNSYFCVSDGVLYDKAKTRLLRYPPQLTGTHFTPPSTCVTIDSGAFSNAVNLKDITIGENVAEIGHGAFYNCPSLTEYIVNPNNTHYMDDDGVLYQLTGGTPSYLFKYPEARPDKHYSVLCTADSIADEAFSEVTLLESVYIPQSVRYLGYDAFSFANVKRVVIDEGLTTINEGAFYVCEYLESLYLPSTISSIQDRAFYYTLNLSEVTIAVNGDAPAIGESAFYGIGYYTPSGRTTVYVPNGMASKYSGLDDWLDAMSEFAVISPVASGTTFTVDSLNYATTDALLNTKVTGVTDNNLYDPGIPPKVAYQGNLCTVTALGTTSMQNCTKMVRADVPFTVSLIDSYSFYGCTKLKKLRLREGLQQINSFAVSHVGELTTLTIPASATNVNGSFVTYSSKLKEILVENGNANYVSIDGVLFTKDRKNLVSFPMAAHREYVVPEGTQVIGGQSFRGASGLTSITFPSTLTSIESSAFYDNSSLSQVVIPKGVTTVSSLAFYKCSSLTRAELPSTLTSLGYNAFVNDPNLKTLIVKATTPPTCLTYINPKTGEVSYPFMESQYTNCTLYVPKGTKASYQAAFVWQNFLNIVEADFPPEFIRGDVNDDGTVDISDVAALIDYLLGSNDGINLYNADVDLNGEVEIGDVADLIDYLLTDSFPEAPIDMWYLTGSNVGSSPWINQTWSIGTGLIPLFPRGTFDERGRGILTYSCFFDGNDAFMLIHTPGQWVNPWGVGSDGNYTMGNNVDAITMQNSGYYTITLDTRTNILNISPCETNPGVFSSITLVGVHNDWMVDDPNNHMTDLNPNKENHEWIFKDFTVDQYVELKMAADDSWNFNWGGIEFPWGIGNLNGPVIPVDAGTYDVYFNDITGNYHFIAK